MPEDLVKVYVTKHALTSGVQTIWCKRYTGLTGTKYWEGNKRIYPVAECQTTENDAVARVEFLIEQRRKMLKNWLQKLDAIEVMLAKGELPMDPKFKGGNS